MNKVDKIWLDGGMVNWDEARVHVLSNALHYGSGVFEGIRCYDTGKGGAVFRLEEHINRLFYSASCLGMKVPYTKLNLIKAVRDTIQQNKIKQCYIRPVVFCGYDRVDLNILGSKVNTAIIVWPWGALYGDKSVSAIISSYRRISSKAVPIDAKINGYYVNSIIATAEAKKKGADESILLDDDGLVAEGAGENIFVVKANKIYTPSLGAILPGITRDSVIKIAGNLGLKVIEKKVTVSDLKKADEIFFTGTAVEVCPVVKLGGRKVGKGTNGPVTLKIKKEYDQIVRGENSKYKKWLTFV